MNFDPLTHLHMRRHTVGLNATFVPAYLGGIRNWQLRGVTKLTTFAGNTYTWSHNPTHFCQPPYYRTEALEHAEALTSRWSLSMRLQLLSLLAALAPYAFADVKFTSPAPGASIPAGKITVQWTESGNSPSISQLSTYTLNLFVGGNTNGVRTRPRK